MTPQGQNFDVVGNVAIFPHTIKQINDWGQYGKIRGWIATMDHDDY